MRAPAAVIGRRPAARAGPAPAGFTLVEMIITIVIGAILAAIAVPSMGVFVKNNARTTRINSLITALNLARSEAVKNNGTVTLCASGAGGSFSSCQRGTVGGLFDFSNGWIVFDDDDGDGTVDAGERVLRVFDPKMSGDVRFAGTVAALTYGGSGAPTRALSSTTQFVYCDDRGVKSARAVLLTPTGQPRVSRDGDGDGIHETASGAALTCPS